MQADREAERRNLDDAQKRHEEAMEKFKAEQELKLDTLRREQEDRGSAAELKRQTLESDLKRIEKEAADKLAKAQSDAAAELKKV